MLASPLTIIERQNDTVDIEAVIDIVRRNDVGKIIIGLPLTNDGCFGMQAEKVKGFTKKLREKVNIPLEFRDESFSTDSARKLMLQTKSKKVRRNTKDDAIAAAFILQHFLDEGFLAHVQDSETTN
jgi:putative holliday junction resolvase